MAHKGPLGPRWPETGHGSTCGIWTRHWAWRWGTKDTALLGWPEIPKTPAGRPGGLETPGGGLGRAQKHQGVSPELSSGASGCQQCTMRGGDSRQLRAGWAQAWACSTRGQSEGSGGWGGVGRQGSNGP